MTIAEILAKAEQLCRDKNKEEHPARMLLMDRLNLESYELFAAMDETPKEEIITEYFQTLSCYLEQNEPIQYILGYEYFAGRNLFVDAGALIPRPETEELVYEILFLIDQEFPETDYPQIACADVGTGSGAIAVSLAAEEPRVDMVATDISEDALIVAKKNASAFASKIQFFVGDMLQPLIENDITLDILVSNPPYIPQAEIVQDIVSENEPHIALFGGSDGLYFYRILLENAHTVINKDHFLLAFEIGFDQAERLIALAQTNFPTARVWVKQDLQGKDRMLFVLK
jgi:protein-(glutamine-N5) methyltransferase, release factor-specific